MQTTTTRRPIRTATPARWQAAAQRATTEGIQVRQLAGCGQWIATSGTDASTAYELDVTGAIAHGCSCQAGLNDDPVCKHRAAYYLLVGAIDLTPEPEPPAPAVQFVNPRGDICDVLVHGVVYGHAVTHAHGMWELIEGVGPKACLRFAGCREAIEQYLTAKYQAVLPFPAVTPAGAIAAAA
ncbi:MAG: hypothetical protein QM692_21110 [Thermomicrobiales bacterium]